MFRETDFIKDYKRGMEMIYLSAPSFAKFVSALGFPRENTSIPSACVSWDNENEKITFDINPDFIAELTDEQVGAVISHEAYHVILQHLDEMLDKSYSNRQFLIEAQECIINDGLVANIGLELPEGVLYGTERHNQDFSYFSTKEGYEFLIKKYSPEEAEEEKENSNGDQDKTDKSDDKNNSDENSESSSQDDSNGEKSKEDSETSEKGEDNSNNESQEQGGDSEETENGAASSNSNGDEGSNGAEASAPGSGTGAPSDFGESNSCGGIQVSDEDMGKFSDFIEDAINGVMASIDPSDIPDDLADILDNITDIGSGYGIGNNHSFARAKAIDNINMNWYKLLAEINPKINDAGEPKPKESWQKPPRRLASVYPKVILPERVRTQPDPKKKGNSVPTFIVALDLSGSIPRSLVSKLTSLVDDVPEDIIKAIPVTWSDYVLEYDKDKKNLVSSGGTNINAVYDYAEQYALDNNCDRPYVLVITDGECSFGNRGYYGWGYNSSNSKSYIVDKEYVKNKWSWCAIQDRDYTTIERYFRDYLKDNNIYRLKDFTE